MNSRTRYSRPQCIAIVPVSKYNRVEHRCEFRVSGDGDLCGAHLRSKRLREERAAKLQAIEGAMIDLVVLGSAFEDADTSAEIDALGQQVEDAKALIRKGLK
jgi:hypothetical protein